MSAEISKEGGQEGGRSAFGNVLHVVAGVALGGHPLEWLRERRIEDEIRSDRLRAAGVEDPGEMFWHADSEEGGVPLNLPPDATIPSPEETAALIRDIPDRFITGQ